MEFVEMGGLYPQNWTSELFKRNALDKKRMCIFVPSIVAISLEKGSFIYVLGAQGLL